MNQPVSADRRRLLADALVGAGAFALWPLAHASTHATEPSDPAGTPDQPLPVGDIHDFDFFVGKWNGANRRLRKRWVGSDDWDEFPSSLDCGSHLGGIVNLDYEVLFPTRGWSGMSLRTFHRDTHRWYLYWVNSRTGVLFPPVVGGFDGDRGEFFGTDVDQGRPHRIRFIWTRIDHDHARWEQAFSLDGTDWETNWICEHTRANA